MKVADKWANGGNLPYRDIVLANGRIVTCDSATKACRFQALDYVMVEE